MVDVCILEIGTGRPLLFLYVILNDLLLRFLLFDILFSDDSAATEHEFVVVVCQGDLFTWFLEYGLRLCFHVGDDSANVFIHHP